jgi:hypothetical protein
VNFKPHPPGNPFYEIFDRLVPKNATLVPEIKAFSKFGPHGERSVRSASMLLANGSTISNFDYVRDPI